MPVPPGYTLDQPEATPASGLPPGYTLDAPPVSLLPGTPGSSSSLVGDWAASGGKLIGGMVNAAMHPIDTAENLAKTVVGATVSGPPGSWQHDVAQPLAQAVGEDYKNAYGSLPAAGNTLLHDPFRVAGDLSMVAAPVEGALRGGAALADVAGRTGAATAMRTGARAADVFQTATNPLAAVGAGLGYGLSRGAGALTNIKSGLSHLDGLAVDYALLDPDLQKTVDVGTVTGNKAIGAQKSVLRKFPTTAGMVSDAENAQKSAITKKMGTVAQGVNPGPETYLQSSGVSLQKAMRDKLDDYGMQAKNAYSNLIAEATSNPQNGIPGPTSTVNLKATAQPMLDQLERQLPETQKQLSPTVTLLRNIINGPDVVSIETAIADNSTIQNLARTEIPQLRTQAQGIAARLIPVYRDSIDQAAKQISPTAFQSLEDGRTATRAKYDLDRAIPKGYPRLMEGKPVGLMQLVTTPKDSRFSVLEKLNQHVPGAMPDVARATIEDIFRGTTEGGTISKIQTAINKWNSLGIKTKQLLFGQQTTEDITNLLNYGKMVTSEANPSGTAPTAQATALWMALSAHPIPTIGGLVIARTLAKGLFNPDTAATIRQTGRLPRWPLPTLGRVGKVVTAPVMNPAYLNTGRAVNNPYR